MKVLTSNVSVHIIHKNPPQKGNATSNFYHEGLKVEYHFIYVIKAENKKKIFQMNAYVNPGGVLVI